MSRPDFSTPRTAKQDGDDFTVLISRVNSVLVALVALAILTGCGFKLRGTVEIPPELNPMYVQGGGETLRAAILQRLEFSDVRLASGHQDARVVIRIKGESRGSRVAAVDRGGKVIASELHYRVTFDAVVPGGGKQVSPQTLDLVRTYNNPDVEVLGKQLEADLIYEDLAEDAADRILERLRAVLL